MGGFENEVGSLTLTQQSLASKLVGQIRGDIQSDGGYYADSSILLLYPYFGVVLVHELTQRFPPRTIEEFVSPAVSGECGVAL